MKARRALIVLVTLMVAVVASTCTSTDTQQDASSNGAKTNPAAGNQPKVTVTQQQPRQPRQAGVTDDLPPEVFSTELTDLEGKTFRISDYSGKIVVLNLWATWCEPCKLEIPHLVDLNREYKDKGVEIIGLSSENPQTAEPLVRERIRELGINYKIGWANRALLTGLVGAPNFSIPQSFIIGRDGRLYKHIRGYSPQIPALLREGIDLASVKKT
jgi:thiol-disulfide isomerase/thioredoxin